jgi:hypothetical protein
LCGDVADVVMVTSLYGGMVPSNVPPGWKKFKRQQTSATASNY